jgi:hypothetical protein
VATAKKGPERRPVIICTEYRGVFFGYAEDTSGDVIHLEDARMVLHWGTSKGVMELAETGPTSGSKLSAKANIEIRKITAVFEVTGAAETKWRSLA